MDEDRSMKFGPCCVWITKCAVSNCCRGKPQRYHVCRAGQRQRSSLLV